MTSRKPLRVNGTSEVDMEFERADYSLGSPAYRSGSPDAGLPQYKRQATILAYH
jgi:hypothetical protein